MSLHHHPSLLQWIALALIANATISHLGAQTSNTYPSEVSKLLSTYSQHMSAASKKASAPLDQYSQALTRLHAEATAAGDLDLILEIEKEQLAIRSRQPLTSPQAPALKTAQAALKTELSDSAKIRAEETSALKSILIQELEKLVFQYRQDSRRADQEATERLLAIFKRTSSRSTVGPVASPSSGSAGSTLSGKIKQVRCIGSDSGGQLYMDVRPDLKPLLVGFDIVIQPFGSAPETVRGVRPIFRTDRDLIEGQFHGASKGEIQRIIGGPGYVVSGLTVGHDGRAIRQVRVRFSKVSGDALDSDGSYETNWFGRFPGAEEETTTSEGKPSLGIHGRAGLGLDAIGLVVRS